MSVAPIVREIQVRCAPDRAFELFTTQMDGWWPRTMKLGDGELAKVVLEPRAEGRWFQIDTDGSETQWGTVLAWHPPCRVVFNWQIDTCFKFDPALHTELEVRFEAGPSGGTRVVLEHRNLERFGTDDAAARIIEALKGGWSRPLSAFAEFVSGPEAQ